MSRLRHSSLRVRIVALATLAVTVTLAVGGWLLLAALGDALTDDLAEVTELRSEELARLAADGALPDVIAGDEDELVQVVRDGEVVAASPGAPAGTFDLPAPPAGETSMARLGSLVLDRDGDDGDEEDDEDDEDDEGEPALVATTSITTGDGLLTVHVASSLEDVAETRQEAARLGLVALPALVAVLALGIWILVGRTLAPVEAIRAEADAITGSQLHRRVPRPDRDDEIGRLAITLNGMLERLEAAAHQQRRFVADAGHELRTPVAALRATLETAHGAEGPVDWDGLVEDLLAETVRVQQLTEQLLLLARVDGGRLAEVMQTVDLDDVVASVVARSGPPGGVHLAVPRLEPVQVTGDPILLGQLTRNLVDNAVVHAAGRVEICVRRAAGHAELCVDDDGPGIPVADRAAVFERFTRLEQSRARAHGGGAGLGLAIVADIARAHGGTVDVEDSPLGGARLRVSLPALG